MRILELSDACNWSGGVEQLVILSQKLISFGEEIIIGCDPIGKLSNFCKENNLPKKEFNLQREINIKTIKEIIAFANKNKIDIIHAHHSKAHALGLIASYWLPNTKFVVHRRVLFEIKSNPFSKFKYCSSRIDGIIAISDAVKKELIKANVSDEKIKTIYSSVDLERFNPNIKGAKIRQEFNIKPGEILIGKIANYSLYKGYEIFLKACKEVYKECKNVKFMLVGDGTIKNEKLEELARQLGICQNIIWGGYRKDIPEIIGAFDISVNTAQSEALGGSILQSSAMAKPVVATAFGGKPEIIKHNETGFLAPPDDYKSVGEYILKLINDKELSKNFGFAGRKFIEENFSSDVMAKKTLDLYKNKVTIQ